MAAIRERIEGLWGGLERKHKLLGAGLAGLFVLMAALTLTMSGKSTYAVAYSGLSPDDAAAIVARLSEQAIPYEVGAGESVIKVPADRVHEVRLDMAGAGLPAGGAVGFELFDSTNLGMTDFTQQLNYRRALEGELARTIASLDAVEQARVHIVIPQPTIYSELEKPPTASVLLKLKGVQRLSEANILGIAHLVSTGVEGLLPENITIVDTKGNVLNDGLSSSDGRASDEHFRAQQDYEQALADKVQAMLETVLGPQRAVVSVNADLDWSQTETSVESFLPAAEGTPPVRSARELRESSGDAGDSAVGAPGLDSNVADVPSYTGADQASATATAQDSGYERSDLTYNYELSKTVSHTTETPGRVRKLSVSVLLDELSDDQQLERIRQSVIAAAGIDLDRGDIVSVETVAFDRSFFEEQQAEMSKVAKQEQYIGLGRWAAIAVAGLVIVLLARGVVMRAVTPNSGQQTIVPHVRMQGVEGLDGGTTALQLPKGDTLTLSAEQQGLSRSAQRHHQLVSLAQKQPEVVAQVIQVWLNEENSRRRA